MVIAAAVLTMVIVFAIAAGAVGREAHLLDAVPARPVFDPDEATVWIAEHLSPQCSASLSYDEVGKVVGWTLDMLRGTGGVVMTSGEVPDIGRPAFFEENEAASHVAQRAAESGLKLEMEYVYEVTLQTLAYLEVIGAIGPVAEGYETQGIDPPD